jgi:hypothetical protein
MTENKIQGVVATLQEPNGGIAFTITCFEDFKYSGFDKKESQEIRVNREISDAFTNRYLNHFGMSSLLDIYTKELILKDLLKGGWNIAYHYIGYGEEE